MCIVMDIGVVSFLVCIVNDEVIVIISLFDVFLIDILIFVISWIGIIIGVIIIVVLLDVIMVDVIWVCCCVVGLVRL